MAKKNSIDGKALLHSIALMFGKDFVPGFYISHSGTKNKFVLACCRRAKVKSCLSFDETKLIGFHHDDERDRFHILVTVPLDSLMAKMNPKIMFRKNQFISLDELVNEFNLPEDDVINHSLSSMKKHMKKARASYVYFDFDKENKTYTECRLCTYKSACLKDWSNRIIDLTPNVSSFEECVIQIELISGLRH